MNPLYLLDILLSRRWALLANWWLGQESGLSKFHQLCSSATTKKNSLPACSCSVSKFLESSSVIAFCVTVVYRAVTDIRVAQQLFLVQGNTENMSGAKKDEASEERGQA
jgi:hypothetical protein